MGQILLVEDETFIAEMIQDALEDRGLEVTSAHTDSGAYAILEGEAHSFTVLIADINLGPGTTGFDVARFARQTDPDLSILYVSGQASRESFKTFGVPGAGFLAKPFTTEELHRAVREALDEV